MHFLYSPYQSPALSEPRVLGTIWAREAKQQNLGTVEARRDLWRSAGPNLVLKQGHLEQAAQDHGQMAFEYLQGNRLQNLSGERVPVLSHPHSESVSRC